MQIAPFAIGQVFAIVSLAFWPLDIAARICKGKWLSRWEPVGIPVIQEYA